MSFGTALVATVAIIMFARMWMHRHGYDHRARDGEEFRAGPPADAAYTAELEREVETLRKRLEVVERIVTDASTSQAHDTRRLASEIEALRDR
ncbi:hypothetical protein F1640_12455 [Novosphingobium sp. NBM11]|uniref:hypothetical protein n=1 Tax=Novosphingobium sp. NBM11 TaxID=2596914 RepID=UPI001892325C|nr:hypothetical protein [Novosphingobium sp. NBM11]MBF5090813.1 hypothetical protein [Novosphingobium sp. NBM11]